MNMQDFPLCCTAHAITDFGGTAIVDAMETNKTTKEVEDYIKLTAKSYLYEDHAMFTAMTNSDQKEANKALRNLGFSHSKWMSKEQHPETKVRLWYISINDLKQ